LHTAGADIEGPLDQRLIVGAHADDRIQAGQLSGSAEILGCLYRQGSMLGVDDGKVKARETGDLYEGGVRAVHERANNGFTALQLFFEQIPSHVAHPLL